MLTPVGRLQLTSMAPTDRRQTGFPLAAHLGTDRPANSFSWDWIVPDRLWETARSLIPEHKGRPQGGGTASIPDDALFAAIVYVLVSGCAWRSLPPCFGVSKSTAHRRFLSWSGAGLWNRLHEDLLRRQDASLIDVSRRILDSAHLRTETGANTQTRDPWSAAERIPRCGPCREQTDCPWSTMPRPA